jgi:hypothetical protein
MSIRNALASVAVENLSAAVKWPDIDTPVLGARNGETRVAFKLPAEQAIGEKLDGSPLPEPKAKNPAAVALGKLGGPKGGQARRRP